MGPGLGEKMGLSWKAHANKYPPLELLPPGSLSLQSATATATSTGVASKPARRSDPGSYKVIAFSPGSWSIQNLVYPPRVEFLFPPVLWNSCDQTPLAFKGRFSGTSSSHCQTPGLGSLIWGSELSLLWENFCDKSFQFVGHSLGRYGV